MTAPENYTKDQIWHALLYYINHVGYCEGVTFISPRHVTEDATDVWELLMEAEKASDFEFYGEKL